MGSPPDVPDRCDDEDQQAIEIARPFLIGVYPVTQALYHAVTQKNPSFNTRPGAADHPVERVSWLDAIRFCQALSALSGLAPAYKLDGGTSVQWDPTAPGFRLPTEAEWEYAARAGTAYCYSGSDRPEEVAWFNKNSRDASHPVGQLKPNAWGLYDMSGNVFEWCWSPYRAPYQPAEPLGADGAMRVVRGGGWYQWREEIRVAYRERYPPETISYALGFRVVRTDIVHPEGQKELRSGSP